MKCFCCGAVVEGWESAEQCAFKKHRYSDFAFSYKLFRKIIRRQLFQENTMDFR